jgi:hypothetical protein
LDNFVLVCSLTVKVQLREFAVVNIPLLEVVGLRINFILAGKRMGFHGSGHAVVERYSRLLRC